MHEYNDNHSRSAMESHRDPRRYGLRDSSSEYRLAIVGSAKADETDARIAGGGGWRGHEALQGVKAGDYSGGARIDPETATPMEAATWVNKSRSRCPASAGWVAGWPDRKARRAPRWW